MKNVTLIYPSHDQLAGTIWDFRHLFQLIREKAAVIILSTLFCVSIAAVYLWFAPRIYSSRAVIYVEQRDKKVTNIQEVGSEDLEAMEVMKTVEQTLQTDEILLAVIKANHLGDLKEFGGGDPANPVTADQLIKRLTSHISIKVRRGTRLIDIVAKSKDPVLAQAIAQSFVDQYLRLDMEQRSGTSSMANSFLIGEADTLKSRLETSERTLQTYREEHNALSLQDSQNIVVDSLKAINTSLNEARADRIRLEADLSQTKRIGPGDPKALLAIPSIATSPMVLDAQRLVSDQRGELADLSRRYRAEHPKYIQAQSRLAELEADYDKTILRVAGGIQTAYQSALENEQKLQAALAQQEQASSDLNRIAIPYNALVHNEEADRDLYQSILTRLKETDITKLIVTDPIHVVETPRVTSKPVSPKVPLVIFAAVFFGFTFGLGVSLLLHSMDTSFRGVEEAERALNLPVIASVPRLKKTKAAGVWKGMPMISEPYSTTAEAFRSLRTMLELKEITDRQILLVTSALQDEGKTFCATNTAVALAHQGYRTLIIDLDLRNPSVAGALHCSPASPGLVDYMVGATTLDQSIQPLGQVKGLSVLTAGSTARNPAELLSADKLARLFNDPAMAAFDRIILDTAPVNAVSDALHLVKFATSTCLVIRSGSTPAKASQRAIAALAGARVLDLAVVLNCMEGMKYYTYGNNKAYGNPAGAGAGAAV
jgi:capsular exopolysaccharide synthesis family protein